MESFDASLYRQYLQADCSDLGSEILTRLDAIVESTHWENPSSPLDWNNRAVMALIAAEQCEEMSQRFACLRAASDSLNHGVSHPLCIAHLALVSYLIGQTEQSAQEAFTTLIGTLHGAFNPAEILPPGLIYLPHWSIRSHHSRELLKQALMAENGYAQALLLLNEVFCRSNLAFYNSMGLRALAIGVQLSPGSSQAQLKYGIANLLNNLQEGVLSLHHANKLAPDSPEVLQSLYLVYQNLGKPNLADFWLNAARVSRSNSESCSNFESLSWRWTELEPDSPFTYIPFEALTLLAVEPGFNSIVTGVLLAEGDWFEREMEFWRNQIQPGMVVIDVGANAGVYTFSAAQRVGSEGRVLAVEPFLGCVYCLTETCRINQISWVQVCHAAASDRNGKVRLTLSGASELNRVVPWDEDAGDFVEVACVALDSLVEQENVPQVDFLKIDAEGHELQVLQGSDRLLSQFMPTILYENMVSHHQENLPVADLLQAKGYRLFRYLPYIQQLAPIRSNEELRGSLNIIAIHQNKIG